MIETPNYDVSALHIETSANGSAWDDIAEDLIELTVSRSIELEGFSTSPNASTATLRTADRYGSGYMNEFGNYFRVRYGSSTLYSGVIRDGSQHRAVDLDIDNDTKITNSVTLSARDQISDLLKVNVQVTIPGVVSAITHGELVEQVCSDAGISIVTTNATLIIGGPTPVQWQGTLLEFLRKMAVSCHSRFFSTNLNALRFECVQPVNTLNLDSNGSAGYGSYNEVTFSQDVDSFVSSAWCGSITGARLGAKKTSVTQRNDIECDTFCAGPQLKMWLAQCNFQAAPPKLPTNVISTDIDNLHVGLVDPGEDALVIYGSDDPYYCAVVGIEHRITPTKWTVTYDLQNPAIAFANYDTVEYPGGVTGDIGAPKPNNKDAAKAPGGKPGVGATDDDTPPPAGGGGGDGGPGTQFYRNAILGHSTFARDYTLGKLYIPAGSSQQMTSFAYHGIAWLNCGADFDGHIRLHIKCPATCLMWITATAVKGNTDGASGDDEELRGPDGLGTDNRKAFRFLNEDPNDAHYIYFKYQESNGTSVFVTYSGFVGNVDYSQEQDTEVKIWVESEGGEIIGGTAGGTVFEYLEFDPLPELYPGGMVSGNFYPNWQSNEPSRYLVQGDPGWIDPGGGGGGGDLS